MELETIRMCAAAAGDGTIGVNAMIAALPIDGVDTRPSDVTIYTSVDHPWVARKEVPERDPNITLPALAILLVRPLEVREVSTSVRDAEASVLFAYLERNAASAELQRNALYANRAMLRFLSRFNNNANGALRSRGGVLMINPIKTEQGLVAEKWGSAFMIAGTMVTWLVRDSAA